MQKTLNHIDRNFKETPKTFKMSGTGYGTDSEQFEDRDIYAEIASHCANNTHQNCTRELMWTRDTFDLLDLEQNGQGYSEDVGSTALKQQLSDVLEENTQEVSDSNENQNERKSR